MLSQAIVSGSGGCMACVTMAVEGTCAAGFERVRDAFFRELF
jgi:hypothetical protein